MDTHGAMHSTPMLALFERYLEGGARPAAGGGGADEANCDLVREGVVVLLGTLARHLPPGDAKVRSDLECQHPRYENHSEKMQRRKGYAVGHVFRDQSCVEIWGTLRFIGAAGGCRCKQIRRCGPLCIFGQNQYLFVMSSSRCAQLWRRCWRCWQRRARRCSAR